MSVFDLASIIKAPGLVETGTLTTDAGAVSISGVYLDKEDIEEFLEMEVESDVQIFAVIKSDLPGDQVKGDTLLLTGRNGGNVFKCIRFKDDKLGTNFITEIYLSND